MSNVRIAVCRPPTRMRARAYRPARTPSPFLLSGAYGVNQLVTPFGRRQLGSLHSPHRTVLPQGGTVSNEVGAGFSVPQTLSRRNVGHVSPLLLVGSERGGEDATVPKIDLPHLLERAREIVRNRDFSLLGIGNPHSSERHEQLKNIMTIISLLRKNNYDGKRFADILRSEGKNDVAATFGIMDAAEMMHRGQWLEKRLGNTLRQAASDFIQAGFREKGDEVHTFIDEVLGEPKIQPYFSHRKNYARFDLDVARIILQMDKKFSPHALVLTYAGFKPVTIIHEHLMDKQRQALHQLGLRTLQHDDETVVYDPDQVANAFAYYRDQADFGEGSTEPGPVIQRMFPWSSSQKTLPDGASVLLGYDPMSLGHFEMTDDLSIARLPIMSWLLVGVGIDKPIGSGEQAVVFRGRNLQNSMEIMRYWGEPLKGIYERLGESRTVSARYTTTSSSNSDGFIATMFGWSLLRPEETGRPSS